MPHGFLLNFSLLSLLLISLPAKATAASTSRAGTGVPALDIGSMCHDATRLDINKRTTYDSCLADEHNTRDQLEKDWGSYSPGMRTRCISLVQPPALPSYLSLQACLNTARDAENLDKTSPNDLLTGGPPNTR
jgi:hypothetical protein